MVTFPASASGWFFRRVGISLIDMGRPGSCRHDVSAAYRRCRRLALRTAVLQRAGSPLSAEKKVVIMNVGPILMVTLPASASNVRFQRQLPAAVSGGSFQRQLPAAASGGSFRRQLPASASGGSFRRQLPAAAIGVSFRQLTASASGGSFRRQLPAAASGVSFRRQLLESACGV